MNRPSCSPGSLIVRAVLGIALPAATAFAADGVVEINQARALDGGVTVIDNPGFPVTLGRPGSYMLTGNLVIDDADTTAIEILVPNVDLDLNGFTIDGPAICGPPSQTTTSCSVTSQTGEGVGVYIKEKGATVRNGAITGMGNIGIRISQFGRGATVSAVRVVGNAAGVSQVLYFPISAG